MALPSVGSLPDEDLWNLLNTASGVSCSKVGVSREHTHANVSFTQKGPDRQGKQISNLLACELPAVLPCWPPISSQSWLGKDRNNLGCSHFSFIAKEFNGSSEGALAEILSQHKNPEIWLNWNCSLAVLKSLQQRGRLRHQGYLEKATMLYSYSE